VQVVTQYNFIADQGENNAVQVQRIHQCAAAGLVVHLRLMNRRCFLVLEGRLIVAGGTSPQENLWSCQWVGRRRPTRVDQPSNRAGWRNWTRVEGTRSTEDTRLLLVDRPAGVASPAAVRMVDKYLLAVVGRRLLADSVSQGDTRLAGTVEVDRLRVLWEASPVVDTLLPARADTHYGLS
jgi:hypothetical protein